jgi:hypothetical protein
MKIAVIVLAVAACSSPDPAPSAQVMTATPDSLTSSDDTLNDLTITVRYDDGDGDLGGGVATITDCRSDELVTMLPIPTIAPSDVVSSKDEITGELDLYVDDVGDQAAATMPQTCSDLGVGALATGQTVFCVELTDLAGHTGTGSCTDPITIAE